MIASIFTEPSKCTIFGDADRVLQEYNEHIHKAKIVREWVTLNEIESEAWTSYSSDLNIFENIWAMMKQSQQ